MANMNTELNDGLVNIKLAKEWCGNPIGASVRVDPLRAKWMRSNGYEEAVDVSIKDTRPELPPIGLMPDRKVK